MAGRPAKLARSPGACRFPRRRGSRGVTEAAAREEGAQRRRRCRTDGRRGAAACHGSRAALPRIADGDGDGDGSGSRARASAAARRGSPTSRGRPPCAARQGTFTQPDMITVPSSAREQVVSSLPSADAFARPRGRARGGTSSGSGRWKRMYCALRCPRRAGACPAAETTLHDRRRRRDAARLSGLAAGPPRPAAVPVDQGAVDDAAEARAARVVGVEVQRVAVARQRREGRHRSAEQEETRTHAVRAASAAAEAAQRRRTCASVKDRVALTRRRPGRARSAPATRRGRARRSGRRRTAREHGGTRGARRACRPCPCSCPCSRCPSP